MLKKIRTIKAAFYFIGGLKNTREFQFPSKTYGEYIRKIRVWFQGCKGRESWSTEIILPVCDPWSLCKIWGAIKGARLDYRVHAVVGSGRESFMAIEMLSAEIHWYFERSKWWVWFSKGSERRNCRIRKWTRGEAREQVGVYVRGGVREEGHERGYTWRNEGMRGSEMNEGISEGTRGQTRVKCLLFVYKKLLQ